MSVARNPYGVIALDVGSGRQISVHEILAHVEHGLRAGGVAHDVEPCPDGTEHHFRSAHLFYLGVAWLHVENGRHVADSQSRVSKEEMRLRRSTAPCREEVVCPYGDASLLGVDIVGGEISVAHGDAFR